MTTDSKENLRSLGEADGFDEIFEMVKTATEMDLGLHRGGLTLVLGDIPNAIGAYHEMGSNAIVMNRNLLSIVRSLSEKGTLNSYVFMILLHEYLHSLGYESDRQVRALGKRISDRYLGEKSVASEMAVKPLDAFFPELPKYFAFRDKGEFETVEKFDSSSTSYIA